MIRNLKLFVLVSVAALTVNAQTTTTTRTSSAAAPTSTKLTPCILVCFSGALSNAPGGCTSFTNATCACTSTSFQTAVNNCLKTNCTVGDQGRARRAHLVQCAMLANSTTSTAPSSSTSTTSPASSSATSPASSAAATTSKSAAMGNSKFGFGELVGAAVAIVGIVVGGGLVF